MVVMIDYESLRLLKEKNATQRNKPIIKKTQRNAKKQLLKKNKTNYVC